MKREDVVRRALPLIDLTSLNDDDTPEVIAALCEQALAAGVAAVSAITNLAEGMGGEELSHEQTLRNAEVAARDLVRLVQKFAEDY